MLPRVRSGQHGWDTDFETHVHEDGQSTQPYVRILEHARLVLRHVVSIFFRSSILLIHVGIGQLDEEQDGCDDQSKDTQNEERARHVLGQLRFASNDDSNDRQPGGSLIIDIGIILLVSGNSQLKLATSGGSLGAHIGDSSDAAFFDGDHLDVGLTLVIVGKNKDLAFNLGRSGSLRIGCRNIDHNVTGDIIHLDNLGSNTRSAAEDPAFNQFCIDLNGVLGLRNFPMHVEFRVDKHTGKAIPIEVNPLRFAGMCLNDLTRHTCGLLPVQAFFEGTRPDYATMWNDIEEDVFSFVVLDKPYETTRSLDFEAIQKHFHGVLETRDIKNPAMSIWGFLFTKTTPEHKEELNEILFSDLQDFMK